MTPIESVKLTEFQIFLSTAEDEKNYFYGSDSVRQPASYGADAMPPGNYRVIDGQIYRISPGTPL